MHDLPKFAKLQKIVLFCYGYDHDMAGVTWQMRRGMCPFTWFYVTGLINIALEEYPILHMCLIANEINIQRSGINMKWRETIFNEWKVNDIHPVCHKIVGGIVKRSILTSTQSYIC